MEAEVISPISKLRRLRILFGQVIVSNNIIATVGPTIWPADPDAVAMARLMALCSGALALPTTAKITPNPVPAIPNPTNIS